MISNILIILAYFLRNYWWLHASENPSSVLCVVSGHLCSFLFIKTYYSIMSNKTLPYHTINKDT